MKFFKSKTNHGNLMVCYDDTDIAKATLRLAQKYAQDWHVALDVVSTFKREEPLAHSEIKRMEDAFQSQIKRQFINKNIPYNTYLLVDIYSSGEIRYSSSTSISDSSWNESLHIDDDGYILGLKTMGFQRMGYDPEALLSKEGGAEFFWSILIEPIQ